MKKYVTLLFFFYSHCFSSQNPDFSKYYLLMNRAEDYLYNKKEYLKAATTLDSILQFDGLTDNNLTAALVNFNLKRYEAANAHFLKYAASGYEFTSFVGRIDTGIFKFRKPDLDLMLKKYPELLVNYKRIQEAAKLKFNLQYTAELIRLLSSDQSLRNIIFSLEEGLDSTCQAKVELSYCKELVKTDSLVFLKLKQLIKTYGLPSRTEIATDAYWAFYFMLMHNYTEKFSYPYCDSILTIARQRFKTDIFITPRDYALIMDRYYINLHKVNYYQEFMDPSLPTLAPEQLNKRRKEIFLPELTTSN